MWRVVTLLGIAGCATTAAAPKPTHEAEAVMFGHDPIDDREAVEPVDAILGLVPPDPDAEISWIAPGPARIEIAASPIETASPNAPPVPGTLIDAQGKLVRVAIRLEHARFSLWMDRTRMFGVIKHEQRLRVGVGAMPNDPQPVLSRGARVTRLARKDGATLVRYVGALEVEGWVPDEAVSDRGPARQNVGRIPSGTKTLTLLPGSVIRAKPEWSAPQIALAANNYFVDLVKDVDAKWTEIAYRDGDLEVHGFYQRFSPPGRTHRLRDDDAPVPIAPNAKVASGTCLYARTGGDAVGYIVGDRDVALDARTNGWWSLAIDTPWGPIEFTARGATAQELEVCAPAGTVPPTTIVPTSP